MPDPRIEAVRRRIDSGRYGLLSLDIFDTFVYRLVPKPTDLFFLLAQALRRRGAMRDSASTESFVHERIGAEERARHRKFFCTEVTLAEIYREFPRAYLRGCSPEELIQAELSLEKELVRINPDMESLLGYAIRKGMKTAFVSDTYFTAEQIGSLVGVEVDFLILSCEQGMSKFQGLHRRLIEKSGLPADRILHVGDNEDADLKGPEVFAIDTCHFPKLPAPYGDLIERELPNHLSQRSAYLSGPDQGLTWLRGRAGFACETEYQKWGAVVLGPVIAGFAGWIARKCEESGICKALCLMREGRFLKRALDLLYPDKPFVCHELYLSRYTALKASIFEATQEELQPFIIRSSPQPLRLILDQLGLDVGDIALPTANRPGDGLLSRPESEELIQRIVRDPRLKKQVICSSRNARENLLKHLSPLLEGVHHGEQVAVVDLGYNGTIQASLQAILSRENLSLQTRGLYLVTGGGIHKVQAAAAAEGWLAENGQPISIAHTFLRSPEFVEQSLMADCGTTLGHNATGGPVLDTVHIPESQKVQIREIQEGILTFCQLWAGSPGKEAPRFGPFLKSICRRILIRAVAEPLACELDLFGGWVHDENLGSGKARPLLGCDLDGWELEHASVLQLAGLKSENIYWPFGLARRQSKTLGAAVAHVFQRTVEPRAFDSGFAEQPIRFSWDTGKGFAGNHCRNDTYRIGNRQRVWKRFSIKWDHSQIARFGFSIGRTGELLQLTGIRLCYEGTGTDGLGTTIRIEHGEVEKTGYRHLWENLYVVEQAGAMLIAPAQVPDHFRGIVHVDIFFGLLLKGA